jgi:hypothetical protein
LAEAIAIQGRWCRTDDLWSNTSHFSGKIGSIGCQQLCGLGKGSFNLGIKVLS